MIGTKQKKREILSAIATRGWVPANTHWMAGIELEHAGLVRRATRHYVSGSETVLVATSA